jgi:nucleoside phosphorylase
MSEQRRISRITLATVKSFLEAETTHTTMQRLFETYGFESGIVNYANKFDRASAHLDDCDWTDSEVENRLLELLSQRLGEIDGINEAALRSGTAASMLKSLREREHITWDGFQLRRGNTSAAKVSTDAPNLDASSVPGGKHQHSNIDEGGRWRPSSQAEAEESLSRVAHDGGERALRSPVDFDVAIICALRDPELTKVLDTGVQPWRQIPTNARDPQTYFEGQYITTNGSSLRVISAASHQMGPPASAVLATKMILQFRPKLVVMVGIAAGVRSEAQGFGDILAAEHTFDYSSGKITTSGNAVSFIPDPKPIGINARLLGRLKHWRTDRASLSEIQAGWPARKPRTTLEIHVGPLGSGSSVLATSKPIDDIVEHWRKLVGIEMEAYAVHVACRDAVEPPPAFLCLKSICDFATEKDDTWQEYAAYTAAQFCHRFLKVEWENLHLGDR